MQTEQTIQLSLPSKGRLEIDALEFLAEAGLRVFKPNPRQYQAQVPALPELGIIFQRPGDIVVSVRQGSIDFGIAGIDVIEEKRGENGDMLNSARHAWLRFLCASPWLSLKRGMMSPICRRFKNMPRR